MTYDYHYASLRLRFISLFFITLRYWHITLIDYAIIFHIILITPLRQPPFTHYYAGATLIYWLFSLSLAITEFIINIMPYYFLLRHFHFSTLRHYYWCHFITPLFFAADVFISLRHFHFFFFQYYYYYDIIAIDLRWLIMPSFTPLLPHYH